MDSNIHVAADADIVRIDGIELDDPEVANYVRSWPPEARADAVTDALFGTGGRRTPHASR